ncbi:hypothetical protein Athai_55930 [Actinocatenispora thailandica]|uniref:Uncharacterized protein n=1 Tax=Actinocatenispora thailandica TaxID=227318 RepID=A0A7R7DUT2_9ACTN|nr:hypothetical protein [Actinocatenispora thailandica]BCJ38090.1 hypothetical protein Athai_55930 [Actinocatenispora thailandica]
MSTESPIPALFRALVDDAALFPPGNAPMSVAVAEHRHHRSAPYTDLVGPLLLPAARWSELVDCLDAAPGGIETPDAQRLGHRPVRLDIGLIGPIDQLDAVVPAARAEPRVALRQLECPVGAEPDPVGAVRDVAARLDAAVDRTVRRFVELPRGPRLLDAVDAIATARGDGAAGAKLRTGGLTADAFPTEPELARFVDRCRGHGQPFKLTAGLHHAVRHTAASTGFEHHGYLNVLAAVCLDWLPDPPFAGTEQALACREAGPLAEVARAMLARPGEAGRSRAWFASYGSCSVAEPLTDLVELGLLDRTLLSHLPAPRKADA